MEVWLKLHAMRISEIKIYSDALDTELPGKLEHILLENGMTWRIWIWKRRPQTVHREQKEKMRETADWLAGLR